MDWNTGNVSGDSKVRLFVFVLYEVYSSVLTMHLTCDNTNICVQLIENTTVMNADVVSPI